MGRHANGARRSSAYGDWRARMAMRGGPVAHLIARAGWLVVGLLFAVLMVGVTVLYAANPGERGADNSTSANLIGGMIVFVPAGAAFGAVFIGLPAQFAARSWLRTPTTLERQAAHDTADSTPFVSHGLREWTWWARAYERCERSVTAYHSIVRTVREGAGRKWLAAIGDTLDRQLEEALRLARLGESLAPDATDTTRLSGAASAAANQLSVAERAFAETAERSASITMNLRDDSDFERVRAQLEMLAAQAPHLRVMD